MSDGLIIQDAADAYRCGAPITGLEARVIAASWHDGQSSALYALVSTGAILAGLADEIRYARRAARDTYGGSQDDRAALDGLRAYVDRHGPRGPQHGWSRLSW